MKLPILRENALADLRANISGNLEQYVDSDPWVEKYFGTNDWKLDTALELPDDFELLHPNEDSSNDIENSKRMFLALRHLSPKQASDERLWAYLAHVTCWKYMRSRWNLTNRDRKGKEGEYIRDRYFFMPNRDRALVRHGIARLWTYGYAAYDESSDDPFELLPILLQKLDITQQLLERSFSRQSRVTHAVLNVLLHNSNRPPDLTQRDNFRDLMRHLNRVGGVTILDVLDTSELRQVLEDRVAAIGKRKINDK